MIDLEDIRQDIFDIKTVPKVLYVYRGDTFELDLDLTISSSELNTVVLNCDGLPEATTLTLLESTTVSSKWHLVLNKTQTLILAPKNHNFTITIVRTDGTELTLYKGIMTVNNRVYSNYSNNYYIAALLKQAMPTVSDNDYLIGTMWVNVLTNRVYFLTSVVNNEANWIDYSEQLDELHIRIDNMLDGTIAFTGVKLDDGNGNFTTMRYTHSNGNHYQVVDIIYPDGRVEQINQRFDNNFRSVVDETLNSGHVLISHGVTQGNQAVDAKLFDETSQDAYNILGVATVDGITKYSKSKATRLGIVTGIQTFFNTGLAYEEGQTLWARQGLLSNVAPSKPGLQVRMGVLINTQGSMDALIFPYVFGKFVDNSDVDMTGVQDGDVIEKRGSLYKPTNRVTELEATRELLENKAEDFTTINQTKYPTTQAAKAELDKKVDKILTIIGLDLQNNILLDEFRIALGNATQIFAGLMSPQDKAHLDGLMDLFEADGDNVVNTIAEVLTIFNNYPEGADLVSVLAGKVDKVEGKQLSTNDLTNTLKDYYDTAYLHSQIVNSNPHQTTYQQLLNKPTTIEQLGVTNVYNKQYIDALKDQNGWESELLTLTPLEPSGTIATATLLLYNTLRLQVKNTSTSFVDTDSVEVSLGVVTGNKIQLSDTSVYLEIGETNSAFVAPTGWQLQIVGLKYTELKASDTTYDNTTSEMTAATVQDAIDEVGQAVEDIINGDISVAKAETAISLENVQQFPVTDQFGVRITAKNNNEIKSATKEKTTASVKQLKGFVVKNGVPDKGEVLTTETYYKILGETRVEGGVIVNSFPKQIISKSNNLFDKSKANKVYVAPDSGVENSSITTHYSTDFIKVNPNTTYIRTDVSTSANIFYTASKTYISNALTGVNITTPANCEYVRFNYPVGFDINTIKLNEGSTALPYQTYQAPINLPDLTTIFPSGMGKLPNGAYDEIDSTSGKAIKRLGEYVIKSTDYMNIHTVYPDVDYIKINKPINYISYNTTSLVDDIFFDIYPMFTNTNWGDTSNIGKFTTRAHATQLWLCVAKGSYTLAQAQTLLVGKKLYYQLTTPVVTPIPTLPATIPTYTSQSTIIVDNDLFTSNNIDLIPLYKYSCIKDHWYYVKAKTTSGAIKKGNLTTNTLVGNLTTSGDYLFQATENADYFLDYTKDGIAKVKEINWLCLTEMQMSNASDINKCRELYYANQYAFGLNNYLPSKLISENDNLMDWEYFYNTLKAVNSDNINIVTKDSRRCIEIKNPDLYTGIKLYQGKFNPNTQYKFRSELFNLHASLRGAMIREIYTDGTTGVLCNYNDTVNSWVQNEAISAINKTIDYLDILYATGSSVVYINTDKFQLQMLDNPETNYLPHQTNELIIPKVKDKLTMWDYYDYDLKRFVDGGNEVALNGSEVWELNTNNSTVDYPFFTSGVLLLNSGVNDIDANTAISSLFNQHYIGSAGTNIEGFYANANGNVGIRVLKSKLPTPDVAGFKLFLSDLNTKGTPLTIQYKKANPAYTDLGLDGTYFAYNYSREQFVDSNGNVVPVSTVINYYRDIVKQVETNTDMIEALELRIKALETLHGIGV